MTRVRARLDLRLDVVRYGASRQFKQLPYSVLGVLEAHLEAVRAADSISSASVTRYDMDFGSPSADSISMTAQAAQAFKLRVLAARVGQVAREGRVRSLKRKSNRWCPLVRFKLRK